MRSDVQRRPTFRRLEGPGVAGGRLKGSEHGTILNFGLLHSSFKDKGAFQREVDGRDIPGRKNGGVRGGKDALLTSYLGDASHHAREEPSGYAFAALAPLAPILGGGRGAVRPALSDWLPRRWGADVGNCWKLEAGERSLAASAGGGQGAKLRAVPSLSLSVALQYHQYHGLHHGLTTCCGPSATQCTCHSTRGKPVRSGRPLNKLYSV
ncbi:PREDICTED: uncharacterized protein LOC105552075 [Mandrillus leucophaeus]|uniref:uncharacterized protein LOC105552075 n=1 Tax=Mandrillus leucophaeus TaxID=9568 RepID=UPI0005F556A0|nr:PREDICTED: uncharacterized protein LOC105552075 [Mandrillus leucophaeus]